MYTLKNGILHQNDQPVIALGVSYYASFHEAKYPVPPEGDRFGEMRTDLQRIRDAGFQHVRTAALGEVTAENGHVSIKTPLIDAMVTEAARIGLSTSIRLQGYVMNLRGFTDYAMCNEKDEPMEFRWDCFLRSTFFHDGMMEDNRTASRELAAHFAGMPEMLGYQIYNEPHYPANGIFDYHPLTVNAYRKWLAECGLPVKDPLRKRPCVNEPEALEEWTRWRRFSQNALTNFLDDSARAAVEGAPGVSTFTDMTVGTLGKKSGIYGMSYFDNARGPMDIVGITSYVQVEGGDAYLACAQYALAESAAALNGKHAWNLEVDARTHMPGRKTHQEVYAQLAAGLKGLIFYEWRGDYPDPNSPNPDNCGIIFNDGSKTEHYDRTIQMVQFVNRHSTLFATAEKLREGVAILFSEHAAMYADGFMNEGNLFTRGVQAAYRELRRAGVCPDFVEAAALRENPFGVRVLLVPGAKEWLDAEELEAIDVFVQAGGRVWYQCQKGTFDDFVGEGWWDWCVPRLHTTRTEFRGLLEVEDILDACGIVPAARTDSRHLLAGAQRGSDYTLIYLINTDPARKVVSGAVLTTTLPFSQATFMSPDAEIPLRADGGRIFLPDVDEGGVVLLR